MVGFTVKRSVFAIESMYIYFKDKTLQA